VSALLGPLVWALGWALIHSLWQGLAIAALVRVLLAVSEAPRVRFSWAWLGSLAIALSFVATARLELVRVYAQPLHPGPELAAPPGAVDLLLPALVAAWAVGLAIFTTRMALGVAGVARLRTRALAVDAHIEQLCAELAAKLGVTARTRVAASAGVEVPVVLGWLRPVILLPAAMLSRLDGVALEAAIAHELAHVRRHDYLLNLILSAVEALMFHHPCVWWLGSVARREREHACDELVVARVQPHRTYARSLLELEQLRAGGPPSTAAAMALDGTPLLDRVRRLEETAMNQTHDRRRVPSPSLPSWAPLLVTALGLGLALALPACLEHEGDSSDPEAATLVEGRIPPGDESASLDIAWLPEQVAAFAPQIEAAARRHGVDPDLLAVMILLESNGNPDAESPSGARGLLQLMPATAEHIARERALSEHEVERLWDPDYNLDLGAWHLAQLLDHWGEIELAAAAYNGGSKLVERWTAGDAELSPETEAYKRNVSRLWAARHEAEAP
jgi:hypothetical protein